MSWRYLFQMMVGYAIVTWCWARWSISSVLLIVADVIGERSKGSSSSLLRGGITCATSSWLRWALLLMSSTLRHHWKNSLGDDLQCLQRLFLVTFRRFVTFSMVQDRWRVVLAACFSVAFARSVPGGHLIESKRCKPLPQVLLCPKIVLLDSSTWLLSVTSCLIQINSPCFKC